MKPNANQRISGAIVKQTLSREEKEILYRSKMTELQTRWGNPLDNDWEFIKTWNDEELGSQLAETSGQLRFEKGLSAAKWTITIALFVVVALGLIGLLLFGIKQLLQTIR